MKNLFIALSIAGILFSSCEKKLGVKWVSTSPDSLFIEKPVIIASADGVQADITVLLDQPLQTIEGFGGCFNELGWITLSKLNENDKNAIIKDLFSTDGMGFTYCRLPIGANDFARDWYSFNETDGDFEMKNFSIDNDKETLIPYIKAAQAVNPNLRLWASPWCPPIWMKYNKHYACRPDSTVNDLKGDPTTDLEGTNMFIQQPEYLEAYALYFQKFIEAYHNEGINIEMVAPQNEFNSCQRFPSCTWTATGLSNFIGEYLGPRMKDMGVRVMMGTMERGNQLLVDTVMENKSGEYISEIGFQWAGKESIEGIHKTYPDMTLMQTESECGDGRNSWDYFFYTWNLMRHYFNNGVSAYMYWNISLYSDPKASRWEWPQNSLISVDAESKTFKYNPEYYLMKHFSHFVKPGSKFMMLDGEYKNALAFKNVDNSITVIVANEEDTARPIRIKIDKHIVTINAKPQSINTVVL